MIKLLGHHGFRGFVDTIKIADRLAAILYTFSSETSLYGRTVSNIKPQKNDKMIRNYNTSFSIESGPFIPAALLELILFVSDVSKRKVTGEILFERSSGDFHAEAFYLF